MRGGRIRAARLARGWSQAQLARITGFSQPYISQLEQADTGSEEAFRTVATALGLVDDGGAGLPLHRGPVVETALEADPLPMSSGTAGVRLMLRRRSWQRPALGGDFGWLGFLEGDSLIIVAGDVVGRGERAALQAGYLRGWLDGFRSQLGVVPDLESVSSSFDRCLRAANIGAAYYVALLRDVGHHTVAYAARAAGFPAPLLIVGSENATLPSVTPGAQDEPRRILLTAPWRLLLASDGLLQRLGSGNESRGIAALRRWLTGPARDEDPGVFLDSHDEAIDDELFVELRWDGWDEVMSFSVADHAKRHAAIERVEAFVVKATGDVSRADAAAAAVAEAFDNARRHGYDGDGPVKVSMRNEGDSARVEIEDAGLGRIAAPGDGTRMMIDKATHVDRWHNQSGGVIVSLTFAKEA